MPKYRVCVKRSCLAGDIAEIEIDAASADAAIAAAADLAEDAWSDEIDWDHFDNEEWDYDYKAELLLQE